jgi:hypothetical protein
MLERQRERIARAKAQCTYWDVRQRRGKRRRRLKAEGKRAEEIAEALKVSRASVFRILRAETAAGSGCKAIPGANRQVGRGPSPHSSRQTFVAGLIDHSNGSQARDHFQVTSGLDTAGGRSSHLMQLSEYMLMFPQLGGSISTTPSEWQE